MHTELLYDKKDLPQYIKDSLKKIHFVSNPTRLLQIYFVHFFENQLFHKWKWSYTSYLYFTHTIHTYGMHLK